MLAVRRPRRAVSSNPQAESRRDNFGSKVAIAATAAGMGRSKALRASGNRILDEEPALLVSAEKLITNASVLDKIYPDGFVLKSGVARKSATRRFR